MLGLIKKVLITLISFSKSLALKAKASGSTKCISLNNQSCMNRPTLDDLNPDVYNQGFHYYPSMVSLM